MAVQKAVENIRATGAFGMMNPDELGSNRDSQTSSKHEEEIHARMSAINRAETEESLLDGSD